MTDIKDETLRKQENLKDKQFYVVSDFASLSSAFTGTEEFLYNILFKI